MKKRKTNLKGNKMNEMIVFDEVITIIAKYKAENEKLVFDYEDKEGAKAAKSHIMKLRKVKTKISEVHKEAKAEALAFGRKLDAKKNEYINEVEEMVNFHQKPLDDIEAEIVAQAMIEVKKREEAEAKRVADLEARETAVREAEEKVAAEKAEAEAEIIKVEVEAERKIAAEKTRVERIEREKRIADEAAETARIRAEQKAKADADAKELAEKRRIANKTHRKTIEDEAISGMIEMGFDSVGANNVVNAIKRNKIPHVTINY